MTITTITWAKTDRSESHIFFAADIPGVPRIGIALAVAAAMLPPKHLPDVAPDEQPGASSLSEPAALVLPMVSPQGNAEAMIAAIPNGTDYGWQFRQRRRFG